MNRLVLIQGVVNIIISIVIPGGVVLFLSTNCFNELFLPFELQVSQKSISYCADLYGIVNNTCNTTLNYSVS